MSPEEQNQLLQCSLNNTGQLRVRGPGQRNLLIGLVRQGYLIPLDKRDVPDWMLTFAVLADNATLVLTEQGKAWIRALDPADFEGERWFPLPRDIREAQHRIGRQP